jgi:transposase
VADPNVFRSGREFAAWLGLVPRQNSTGGKPRLGGITKRGNRYLRRQVCTSSVATARHAGLTGRRICGSAAVARLVAAKAAAGSSSIFWNEIDAERGHSRDLFLGTCAPSTIATG